METHQIIKDADKLKEFIEWLPDLEQDEVFLLCLQARKKYMSSLKSNDKCQLKRFVSTKDRLFEKIKQLECPVGSYTTDEGEPITDDALVLYITLNPRCMRKATFASMKAFLDLIQRGDKRNLNPHSEVLSQIHKSKARTAFVQFDIDSTEKLDIEYITSFVGVDAVKVIKTRGGYHLLVNPKLVQNSGYKNWYQRLQNIPGCDQNGDLMVPVVGCNQGGFTPYFYKDA